MVSGNKMFYWFVNNFLFFFKKGNYQQQQAKLNKTQTLVTHLCIWLPFLAAPSLLLDDS